MATATPERASPEFPIALLSRAVAASTAMLQLIAAVAAISLDRVLEAEGTARARARDPARGRAGLTLLGGVALTAGGVAALATGSPPCGSSAADGGGTARR